MTAALADLPALAADGWRVVYAVSAPERGHDVLLERHWVEHVAGRCLPCEAADCARVEAWARNLDVTVEVAVSILASRLAPVEVYERAVRK